MNLESILEANLGEKPPWRLALDGFILGPLILAASAKVKGVSPLEKRLIRSAGLGLILRAAYQHYKMKKARE